jgi:putative acetyltransferase
MGGGERGDNATIIDDTLHLGGRLWVMELDGEIIGSNWVSTDGRRLYLHHFGIRPAWQGKGFAHRLLKPALELASSRKMQIKLEVHTSNAAAINLYRKHGFAYLGDYEVYIIRNPECVS